MARSVTTYVLDIAEHMAEEVTDPQTGEVTTALELCREYIARKLSPKVQGGRKTEHAGLVVFGGQTNNPYFAAKNDDGPDPADYVGIASVFPPQTANPNMYGRLQAVKLGKTQANPIAALFVVDELLRTHAIENKAGKYKKEVVMLTSGKRKLLGQGGYEPLLELMVQQNLIFRVIGVGYDERSTEDIENIKDLPKSEQFWRKFVDLLTKEQIEQNLSDELYPALGNIHQALEAARAPSADQPSSTAMRCVFRIGEADENAEQANNPTPFIEFPFRYSKATSIARPQSMSKVVASQVARPLPASITASQARPSAGQYLNQPTSDEMDAVVSSYVRYVPVPQQPEAAPDGAEPPKAGTADDMDVDGDDFKEPGASAAIEKELLTKAYKFGSTWVPLNEEDFDSMYTKAGMEVLGFMDYSSVPRHEMMGEVYYLWPEPDNSLAQIKFSSLAEAMMDKEMYCIVRWVTKEGSAPKIGACLAARDFDNVEYMSWLQLPFAEDERNFFFAPLGELKNKAGDKIETHRLLPTEDQLLAMDSLVDDMDLDQYEEEIEEDDVQTSTPWFQPQESYNPAIHRLKDVVFHQATTLDLSSNPIPPAHPALTKFLESPSEIQDILRTRAQELKQTFNVKLVPPPMKKADKDKNLVGSNEENFDIEGLIPDRAVTEKSDSQKPLITLESPLEDMARIVNGDDEGDEKLQRMLKEMPVVIKQLVSAKTGQGEAFSLAMKCLSAFREHAATFEESDVYNTLYTELKAGRASFWKDHLQKESSLGLLASQ